MISTISKVRTYENIPFWRDGCHSPSLLCSLVFLPCVSSAPKCVQMGEKLPKNAIIHHIMIKKSNLHTILEGWLS